MSKAPKESFYCLLCDWEIIDTHKHLDGIRCPTCEGPVMTGKRQTPQEELEEIKTKMESFSKIKERADENGMASINIIAVEKSMNWLINRIEELERK